MHDAQISVALARDILLYLESQGIPRADVCQVVGLSSDALEDPDALLSGTVLQALWQEGSRRTGDPHLGLHVGEGFALPRLGLVGYGLLSCQTFGQALEHLCHYTSLVSQGIRLSLQRSRLRVQCDCEILNHPYNYLHGDPRQPIESTFAALMQATLALTGKPLQPHAIWFQHPAPPEAQEHERIFKTVVHFSRPINRLIFDARSLDWPILSSHQQLYVGFRQQSERLLHLRHQAQPWSDRVAQVLLDRWANGIPTLEAIAKALQVSQRHLQRHLQSEGTSYQAVLDDLRRELALQQLQDPLLSIQSVAFGLGFSEPSAFHRAFKRWTGQTPQTYRAQQSMALKP
jgi:AraC-like DNA-binding protein